ncbi:MAG: RNA 2',3'-cyclic phosphodiesterase [Eubacterium sp.]|nr:RNA 2',3'-cyclic phosphodiesterase [Eubacterium sp.]
MRLFISINFDKKTTDLLQDLQAELQARGIRGNYTRPENLHLTLAFIGEYVNPDDILDILETISFEPFTLRLESLSYFRDMIFADISDCPPLEKTVRKLRRALAEKDIPFDRKKFLPHITLVRKAVCRDGRPLLPLVEPPWETKIDRISLMRSERGKKGMIYTELG